MQQAANGTANDAKHTGPLCERLGRIAESTGLTLMPRSATLLRPPLLANEKCPNICRHTQKTCLACNVSSVTTNWEAWDMTGLHLPLEHNTATGHLEPKFVLRTLLQWQQNTRLHGMKKPPSQDVLNQSHYINPIQTRRPTMYCGAHSK